MSRKSYFQGKVAAITGAGSGIGRALAVQLAETGCSVAIGDINEVAALQTAKMLEGKPVKVTVHPVDVADHGQVHGFAHEVVEHHGKVDIVINNAGVVLSAMLEDVAYKDLEWLLQINLWGVVYGAKEFLPYLKERPEAHLVNMSSVHGLFTNPRIGPYCISKFAVRAFSQALCQELKKTSVHVSCVHPGGIKTNLVRNGRFRRGKDPEQTREQAAQYFDRFIAWTSPERAARVILCGIRKKKKRILVGPDAHFFALLERLFPNAWQALMSLI